jgi:branched-subunit amino acid transport protein
VEKLLIFLGMALATFFTRYAGIAVLGRKSLAPDGAADTALLYRWLRHIPPAVLAALIVPAILAPRGSFEVGLPVWALLGGAVVAWRTRNVLWTIVGGMAVYWALSGLGF